MKKIFIALLFVIFVGAHLQSCTNLDEKPFSSIPSNEFFNSEEEFVMSYGQIYAHLTKYTHYFNIWGTIHTSTDEALSPMREGGLWLDNGVWRELHDHTYTPHHDGIRQTWGFIFEGITLCNLILYDFDLHKMEFEAKSKMIAEVKTLRAWLYLNGMDLFGNIPLSIDFTDTSPAKQIDRKELFTFVEKEINDNIELLENAPDGDNYGRATKAFAYTILAKLYINAEEWIGVQKWQETIDACDKVIALNEFEIEDDYFSNFKADNDGSSENIFVIMYDKVYKANDWQKVLRFHQYTLNNLSAKTFGILDFCWNGFCTTQGFYEMYDSGDARIGSWLAGPQFDAQGEALLLDGGAQLNYTPEVNSLYDFANPALENQGVRFAKYEYENGLQGECMNNDYVVYRYADVLMMKGEALVRQGKASQAYPLFNQVRARTGLADYVEADMTLDEILDERGREFAWEGVRRQDLIRFGKWTQARGFKGVSGEYTKLFPIPARITNLNKGLKQNPGYTN